MEKMTCNEREFTVVKLLGRGKGGYSYLVTDGNAQYVLKQIHHEPCDYYTFGDKLQSELNDYARLCAAGVPVPELLEYCPRLASTNTCFSSGVMYHWVQRRAPLRPTMVLFFRL